MILLDSEISHLAILPLMKILEGESEAKFKLEIIDGLGNMMASNHLSIELRREILVGLASMFLQAQKD